jgi:hypothetical protein
MRLLEPPGEGFGGDFRVEHGSKDSSYIGKLARLPCRFPYNPFSGMECGAAASMGVSSRENAAERPSLDSPQQKMLWFRGNDGFWGYRR